MIRFFHPLKRTLTSSRTLATSSAALTMAPLFSIDRKVMDEPLVRYKPGGYHPVAVGETYSNRYEVVKKIGWGVTSTVWLVHDTYVQRQSVMKVLVSDLVQNQSGFDELGVLKTIGSKDPQAAGREHIVQLLDNFTHDGPNGSHTCLILEPMGVSTLDFYRATRGPMPLDVVKRISKHILEALQYLHEDCEIIHTDLKGDNIMMTCASSQSSASILPVTAEDLLTQSFKLSDFGSANYMSNRAAPLIQPAALRCPEVIVGAEWTSKADIWNFGCLMYEFSRGAVLFDPFWQNEKSGMNAPQTHLAQIIGLAGEFPLHMITEGEFASRYFDAQGSLLLGRGKYNVRLQDLLAPANHPLDELPLLVDFLSRTLVIDPAERWSASELLGHPWLEDVI
ncbi:hypothetical protein HGRIS_003410 [Hohenbuehelia grisea]|uniref:non-specific serine/threonine protein kinase n=1 Tax=Hohenbuehelia grisea TaxID=104357 RepID=A0ABR3JFC9_9AGAR